MALIDLGEASHNAPEHVVPVNVPRVRRLALAVVAVVGMLALSAAAPPGPPTVRPLWTAPLTGDETVTLTDDTAFLSTMANGGEVRLTSYDMATGAVRWIARTGTAMPVTSDVALVPAGDIVLVPADPVVVSETVPNGNYYYSFNRITIALDARTGVERWRTAGEARAGFLDGTALVTEFDDAAHLTKLRRIRVADGNELWSRPTPATASWTTMWRAGQPIEIVTAAANGEIHFYRYADGTLRLTGRLPWRIDRTQDADIYPAGAYLAVRRSEVSSATTTIYDPGDLSVLWRTVDRIGYVTGCGALLCTVTETAVVGRDPTTGRERWRAVGMQGVTELTPDRLLLEQADANGTRQLVEAATGRAIGPPATGQPASAHNTWGTGALDGAVLILHRTLDPPARVAVTRLNVDTGEQSLLGTINQIGDLPCTASARYLACRYADRLTVTAVG